MQRALNVPKPREPGPCVLLADDDADMLEEVTRALRSRGCAVIAVASGELLIDYLGRCTNFGGRFLVPDVIVSDIWMPGYSGLDLVQALQDAEYDIPIILMTAFGDERIHDEAKRLGAIASFDKPFDADDLSTAVLCAWCPRPQSQDRKSRRRYSSLRYDEGLRARDTLEQHLVPPDPIKRSKRSETGTS